MQGGAGLHVTAQAVMRTEVREVGQTHTLLLSRHAEFFLRFQVPARISAAAAANPGKTIFQVRRRRGDKVAATGR